MDTSKYNYDTLVFDLDDTLYPLNSGLSEACTKLFHDFMHKKLGIEKTKVPHLSTLLYKTYGTTTAGLRAIGYDFEYDDIHSFVHRQLPYQNLKPDPLLRSLLLSLPYKKVIFTNADRIHAAEALSRLGLDDCFHDIICFETLNDTSKKTDSKIESKNYDLIQHFYESRPEWELPKTPIVCKPSEVAIREALKIANIDPKRAIFFDDSLHNIQAGKRVGLHTVLVGTSHRVPGADFALESIHNIRDALPELWNQSKRKLEGVRYSDKVSFETCVV